MLLIKSGPGVTGGPGHLPHPALPQMLPCEFFISNNAWEECPST